MPLHAKKLTLTILGVTAVVGSRALFFFFDDPEGPNLLVVGVTATIVFLTALPVFLFVTASYLVRFSITLLAQALILGVLYVLGLYF